MFNITTSLSKFFKCCCTICNQLWLSVSSVDFYQKIISSYRGYGIRYILTISFISSLFCSIIILNYLNHARQYFSYGVISPAMTNIDHILSQFPELKYDGKKISLKNPKPIYISNIHNRIILAIDPENRMLQFETNKIPLVLTSKNIIFTSTNRQKINQNSFPLEYQKIFGNKSQFITKEMLRYSLERFVSQAPEILIYLIFPFITFFIFLNTLVEKCFVIMIMYILTKFLSINIPIKVCSRLAMFSGGVFVICYTVILLTAPYYINLTWIIQIWTNSLIILAILKFSNQSFFKKMDNNNS